MVKPELPDLKFRNSWSVDYGTYNEFQYRNSLTNLGVANKNLGTSSISNYTIWTNEQTLSYQKNIGKNSIGALLGNSIQGTTSANTLAQDTSFPNDSFELIASATNTTSSSADLI